MDETNNQPPEAVAVRSMSGSPGSINVADRTVEVVWTIGARGRNRVEGLGDIVEELDLSAGAVRMDLLRGGNAPVLNVHQRANASSVLGRVVAARIEGGVGHATLRFSSAADVEPIWQRIVDGSLRNISVGYRVFRYERVRDPATGEMVHRAVDWEPFEISVVPVPVDRAATIRSDTAGQPAAEQQPHPSTQETDMADTPTPVADAAAVTPPAAPTPAPAPEAQRAAPVPTHDAATEAVRAERARIADLTPVAHAARALVAPATVDALHQRAVSEGWAPEALRASLWDAAVASGRPPSIPAAPAAHTPSGDDIASIVDAMGDAIVVRAMPGAFTPATQRFREFSSLRPSDMLVELAIARGERVSLRNRGAIVERAFHTTSDFPLLLENAGNKMLMAGFQAAAPSYRNFFGQRAFNDFKAHKFLMAGDFPALAEVREGGEITAGTISEKRESITPKTYGRQVRVTRQMMVNDDLGAFTDFGAMIGRRVADYENALAYALVNTATGDGPTLSTGSAAVFGTGATRLNKAATGAAISETTLDTGYAGIMAQTSLDGIKLNLQPRFLLTGTAYRGAALRYTTRIIPGAGANVGLYSDLVPISDANVSGNHWYLFADPAAAPVYVYGYVNGQSAPQVRVHQYVPGTDGIAIEVVHDFAVGAVDHRGGWYNAGA